MHLITRVRGTSLFHYRLKLSDDCLEMVITLPIFHQELINFWIKISCGEPSSIEEICSESLRNNTHIIVNRGPFFNKMFAENYILTISDLLSQTGSFLSWLRAKQKHQLMIKQFV